MSGKLIALDEDDLAVISAHVQDAVVKKHRCRRLSALECWST
jgi:hypothetical protein